MPAPGTLPPDRNAPTGRSPGARDLEAAVRAELAAIEPQRSCCRTAERAGLGASARGRARSAVVARLAVRLEGAGDERWDDATWRAARAHCRTAYLRGRLLAVGSLSLGSGGSHLEFVVPSAEAPVLASRLSEAGFPASVRARRGRGVVTWKSTETVLSFLRACGASASVLEVESRLVTRQLRGHLNRVLNAETANLARSVASAARQLAVIEALESEGRLSGMAPIERAVAQERRASPEASFTELAANLGLSRARVQRAFERLSGEAAPIMEPCDPSSSAPTGR